jgi:hypothetical protein
MFGDESVNDKRKRDKDEQPGGYVIPVEICCYGQAAEEYGEQNFHLTDLLVTLMDA